MLLSVIIPTHHPRPGPLGRVLDALAAQTLPADQWELVLVDNASSPPVPEATARRGHAAGRVVREERTGLTAARLAGFAATTGDLIVLVDDDNVLFPDYLATARRLAEAQPRLGAWSGRIDLEFAVGATPPPARRWGYLAHRQPPAAACSDHVDDHGSTPWGAGLCLRRAVAEAYREVVRADTSRIALDLQGTRLIYGGDTDLAYTACDRGFLKGVFPELRLRHLIPAERCTPDYFRRAIEGHGYSEQLHRLIRHGHMENPRRPLRRWLGDWWQAWRAGPAARLELRARHRGLARAWRELSRAP